MQALGCAMGSCGTLTSSYMETGMALCILVRLAASKIASIACFLFPLPLGSVAQVCQRLCGMHNLAGCRTLPAFPRVTITLCLDDTFCIIKRRATDQHPARQRCHPVSARTRRSLCPCINLRKIASCSGDRHCKRGKLQSTRKINREAEDYSKHRASHFALRVVFWNF